MKELLKNWRILQKQGVTVYQVWQEVNKEHDKPCQRQIYRVLNQEVKARQSTIDTIANTINKLMEK